MKKIFKTAAVLAVLLCLGLILKARIEENYAVRLDNELKRNAPIKIPDPSITAMQDIKDKKKPVIALFYVDWCTYCRRFMPIFGEAAKEYSNKFNFAVVHCEKPENKELVNDVGVQGFPTLYIFDRKIDYKFPVPESATQDKESFEKELNKYLELRKHFKK